MSRLKHYRFFALILAEIAVLTILLSAPYITSAQSPRLAEGPDNNIAPPLPLCGDGVTDAGESCDDGNTDSGDGCSATCTIESCGDGITNLGEDCDDSNTADNDGCSAACVNEICGDAITNFSFGQLEGCDDGNTAPGDGCGATCQTETCGNTITDPGEGCDDGNLNNGDGCDAACQIEPECGNGIPEAGEACDDGNNFDGDGCQGDCTFTPAPVCGNGALEAGEGCDDGNLVEGDGCDATCNPESIIDPPTATPTNTPVPCTTRSTVLTDGETYELCCPANTTLMAYESSDGSGAQDGHGGNYPANYRRHREVGCCQEGEVFDCSFIETSGQAASESWSCECVDESCAGQECGYPNEWSCLDVASTASSMYYSLPCEYQESLYTDVGAELMQTYGLNPPPPCG